MSSPVAPKAHSIQECVEFTLLHLKSQKKDLTDFQQVILALNNPEKRMKRLTELSDWQVKPLAALYSSDQILKPLLNADLIEEISRVLASPMSDRSVGQQNDDLKNMLNPIIDSLSEKIRIFENSLSRKM